jgi:hypothetical protein
VTLPVPVVRPVARLVGLVLHSVELVRHSVELVRQSVERVLRLVVRVLRLVVRVLRLAVRVLRLAVRVQQEAGAVPLVARPVPVVLLAGAVLMALRLEVRRAVLVVVHADVAPLVAHPERRPTHLRSREPWPALYRVRCVMRHQRS